MNPTRKLAAIIFTDIVGYTVLSSKDERKAFDLIQQQRDLVKPVVKEFNGNWLKEVGDGVLMSFPSTIQAVRCAVKIQQTVKDVKDLKIRIGIHQGDILEKDGDVFGDDVNIASRLEPFSAPGGIVVSGKVQQDISSKPEFKTKYIGKPKLKGVEQEVKVYCITSHGLPETKRSEVSAKLEKRPIYGMIWAIPVLAAIAVGIYLVIPGMQEVPSVGILYMENLGSEEDEFWARGITEDVIIEVASAGLIRVAPMKEILEFKGSKMSFQEIAEKLRVKYVLTSSIHKLQDFLNLRVQLLEVKSGNSVYAEKLKEPLNKAGTITGIIAGNVINSLGISTMTDVSKPHTTNPDAYEFYLKGKYRYEKRENKEDTEVARGLLRKAIEIDSLLVKARVALGYTYVGTGDYESALQIFDDALDVAESALHQGGLVDVLRNIGIVYEKRGEYDEALMNFKRSLKIARKIGDRRREKSALYNVGIINDDLGNYDEALQFYNISLEIDRELEDRIGEEMALYNIGGILVKQGEYDEALLLLERSLLIARELGDRSFEGMILNTIGTIGTSRGDYYGAIRFFEQSLEITRELGDRSGEKNAIGNIGIAYYYLGDYDESLKFYKLSLEIIQELGERAYEGTMLNIIGSIYTSLGNFDEAFTYFEKSLKIANDLGDIRGKGYALGNIGNIYYYRRDYDNAMKFFKQSQEIIYELSDLAAQAELKHSYGHVYLDTGKIVESIEYFKQTIDIFRKIGAKQNINLVQSDIALALLKLGDDYQTVTQLVNAVEKSVSTLENEQFETLWNLAQLYQELGNIEGMDSEYYDIKYKQFLEVAYRKVLNQAGNIKNDKDKESFLNNFHQHREVISAWEKLNNSPQKISLFQNGNPDTIIITYFDVHSKVNSIVTNYNGTVN